MTMENTVVNHNYKAEDVTKEIIPEYVHTKTGNHSRGIILKIRFVKEEKGTKPENSVGFARFTDALKKACKVIGVKAYYSAFITRYKKDGSGNFIRDEYGDRVKTTEGGFLLETAQDGSFDPALADEAQRLFYKELLKGLNDGTLKLAPPKTKKTATGEVKKPTKSDLELEIIRLKKALAEAQANQSH